LFGKKVNISREKITTLWGIEINVRRRLKHNWPIGKLNNSRKPNNYSYTATVVSYNTQSGNKVSLFNTLHTQPMYYRYKRR